MRARERAQCPRTRFFSRIERLQKDPPLAPPLQGGESSQSQIHPQPEIVDAGILAAEQLRVAHVDPARFDAEAIVDLRADRDFGLEKHAASELDLVVREILEFLRRPVVDRNSQARAEVETAPEFRRQSDRGVAGVACGVERAEDIGLDRRVADRTAFMFVDTSAGGRTGYLIEYRPSAELFEDPREERTKAYIRGEFS